MSNPTTTRQKILETAVSIVDANGAAHLTIDAVAAAASLSKGGVLYHFPSKRALLEAMLALLMETSKARIEKLQGESVALAQSSIEPMIQAEQEQQPKQRAMALAILAAAAEDPTLLNPAKTYIADRFREAGSDTTDPQLAHILLLAAEGLRFLDMLNLLPEEIAHREQFFDRLLQLARNLPR
jgi:AcrR family transcriptional regulator